MLTSITSSLIAGLAACCAMIPVDVVTTRLYNQPVDRASGKGCRYAGIVDAVRKISRTEGLPGFYKGSSASLLRQAPHTVLCLLFWQEIRKAYHNDSLPAV